MRQQYEATAIISMAPAPTTPNGLLVTGLAASADAQLVPSLSTARAATQRLPPSVAASIDPAILSGKIISSASVDNQLLFVTAEWQDASLAPALSNAVASAFIAQERRRLEGRYIIINRGLLAKQRSLSRLIHRAAGPGAAMNWLQAQYADALSKVIQEDADARIEASMQEASLTLAEPANANSIVKVGPKALVNGLLGGALAFVLALLIVFTIAPSDRQIDDQTLKPVLAKTGD